MLRISGLLVALAITLAGCGGGGGPAIGITGSDPVNTARDSYDLSAITDPSTAFCSFTNLTTATIGSTSVSQWEVSYKSWQYVNGSGLEQITITGYAAKPTNQVTADSIPGVVIAHGLGGSADQQTASELAALLDAYVIMYDGPGAGNSGGVAWDEGGSTYSLFNVLESVQGSWFWAHSVAGMRGLTCLGQRYETDVTRLGMTGGSAGAIATMLAAAVDDRVVAAVPISGSFALDLATQSDDAWEHYLLAFAGLDTGSDEWTRITESLLAPDLMADSTAATLMINGSSDEYFPVSSWQATFEAMPQPKRKSLIANFDHGCYDVDPAEDPATIAARANTRVYGGTAMWFGYWFDNSSDFTQLPGTPQLELTVDGTDTLVSALADNTATAYDVSEVTLWWSVDNAWSFQSLTLSHAGGVSYTGTIAEVLPLNTVAFVDVLYTTGGVSPQLFSFSSDVLMPDGFVANIRPASSCL